MIHPGGGRRGRGKLACAPGEGMPRFRVSQVVLGVYAALAALCAVFYFVLRALEVLDSDQALPFALISFVLVLCSGAGILLVVWTYVDAEKRGMSGALWALLVLFLNFPFLIGSLVYLLLRRPLRGACPGCGGSVDPSFSLCPHCGRTLRVACPNCGTGLRAAWRVCPNCGTAAPAHLAPPGLGAAPP